MVADDKDIVAYLGALINGEMSMDEAEAFLKHEMLAGDAREAVSHYIDGVSWRERALRNDDSRYEIWSRLGIFDAYCSYKFGERFSIRRYASCLACRWGWRYEERATNESCSFCLRRWSLGFSWELEMEFFVGQVRVVEREGSLFRRFFSRKTPAMDVRQLYCGSWLGLDLLKLGEVAFSGDVDLMRNFAKGCREGEGKHSSGLSVSDRSDAGSVNAISNTCAEHKRGDCDVVSFLASLIRGEVLQEEAEAFFDKFGNAFSDDAYEAVSHYVDDFNIRKKNLGYEIRMRMYLLDSYVSLIRGKPFGFEPFVRCLACRLGCRIEKPNREKSMCFQMRRRYRFRYWGLQIEFFLEHIHVEEIEGPLYCRSKRKRRQIYDGPWLDLDFDFLGKSVLISRCGLGIGDLL